jgi:hypothetical protein
MHATRRYLILLAAASVFIALFAVPAMAGPAGQFVSKINSSRSAAGLPPVQGYWDLADDARRHSNSMAERGELYHSGNLGRVTSGWTGLGENVGVGIDVSGLHQAFMNSSGHRRNILGNFNYVGVGVTVDDEGFMWVTVIFMKAPDGLNDPVETTTTLPPTTTTTTLSPNLPAPPTTTTTTQASAPTTTTTTTTSPAPPPASASTTTTKPPPPPPPASPAATQQSAPAPTAQPTVASAGITASPVPDIGGVPAVFFEIWGKYFLYGGRCVLAI